MNDLHHPCEPWAERISLAAAGCLSADEQQEVGRHIETCSDCRERLQQLTQLCGALAELWLPAAGREAAIVERVMSAVASRDAETARPALPARSLATWRWIVRSPVARVAAAAVFVLAIGGVAVWFYAGGTTPAFADLIRPILEAKTVKCKQTVKMKGPPATTIEGQWMMNATRSRMETVAPHGLETVTITDWSKGRSLCLFPAAKRATILDYGDAKNARNDLSTWILLLQTARDSKTERLRFEPLGEKQIDGHRAVGFRVTADRGTPLDLWGDPKTHLPVRVEMTLGMDGNTKVTMSDFVFNADMDESLFSVEPPAGYTVDRQKADSAPDEERGLTEMFRQYAKLTGGAFPKSLDMQMVSFVVWKKLNSQAVLQNLGFTVEGAKGKVLEEQRQMVESLMDEFADKIYDNAMKGKVSIKANQEFIDKFTEQMSKMVIPMTVQMTVQKLWDGLALEKLKANEEQRRAFEKRVHKIVEGRPNELQARMFGEEIMKFAYQMLWDDLAPARLRANEELRRKFEELMLRMEGKPNEKQKTKEEVREILGDQMLKGVEAWEAQKEEAQKAQMEAAKARSREAAEESRKFMEAQQLVGRGLEFANHLPPAAEAHYAGKGVSLGAADMPIFWYRPNHSKKYRVIYGDLTVRDAGTPPNVPKAQPVPAPSDPKR